MEEHAHHRAAAEGFGVIIPAYMEAGRIGEVVRQACGYAPMVIVVDDGSTDETSAEAQEAGAIVLRHEGNRGKGDALNTGFAYARERRLEFVITMDGDGQHDPTEIPKFVEAYRRTGIPVLIGNRMVDTGGMPWTRRVTNRLMSRLLSRTMDRYVPDTQCGFRLYRCDIIPFVSARSAHFAAESETLIHVTRRGIRIDMVRVRTIYHKRGSRIRPLSDAFRFFRMLWQVQKEKRK